MCRSIKVLRIPGQSATPQDAEAAALQYVRKISGFRKPSKVNQEAFDRAVDEIAASSRRLLQAIEATSRRGAISIGHGSAYVKSDAPDHGTAGSQSG